MVTIRRPGRDATVVAWGPPVEVCLSVAEAWAGRGVDVEVLDLGPPAQHDEPAVLASVSRTKNAVIVDGSAELACRIHEELFADLEHAVQRVAAPGRRDDIDSALRRILT